MKLLFETILDMMNTQRSTKTNHFCSMHCGEVYSKET